MPLPKSLRKIEIEQQIRFGFTEDVIKNIVSKDCIDKYAYVLHNMENDDHYHLMLWFKNPIPTENVIKWLTSLGVTATESQLEKIKKDESALAYLTHANRPEKYQYPKESVITNIPNLDTIVEREKALSNIKPITDKILSGQLTEKDFWCGDYGDIYLRHKRTINDAFEYYYNQQRGKVLSMEKDINVIFVEGASGTGKTSYVIEQCKAFGIPYCKSSSSNDILQDYKGEEVLILDDLRDNALRLSDFLKFTDPHVRSTTQSRYRNKCFCGSVIYITTTLPMEEWYMGADALKEERKQFTRRIHTRLKFTKEDITVISITNDGEEVLEGVYPNPMQSKYDLARRHTTETCKMLISGITSQPKTDGFVSSTDEPFTSDGLPLLKP